MRIFVLNIFLMFMMGFVERVEAQNEFDVTKISPELIADANAVVRLEDNSFDIVSKGEARSHRRMVVTILNERGEEDWSQLMVGYDKFTKITDISGVLYDATGKVVKKLRGADIEDFGYGSEGDEITDARVKVADFGKKSYSYPYTIEFSYDTKEKNMMFYPVWMPFTESKTAVEHSRYTIKAPAGFKFRYKEYNGVPAVVKSKSADGSDMYQWAVSKRIVPKNTDAYPLPLTEYSPLVMAAPSDFQLQDYQGNFNTWEDFGKFYHTLNVDRDALPPATVAEIKSLVTNAKSDREKVEKIYKWMQERSRYVSIQLGIGGWQTMDATMVATKGYGDCKALSNFTVASLRQAGITSYVALIKAGNEATMKSDFPSSQFNHVIACAIVAKDTIWLECTNQTSTPNFMGTFTGSRHALLVTPEGGKLVRTPVYQSNHNTRKSYANVSLDEGGNGQVEVQTRYAGVQQESRNSLLHNGNKEDQKNWIINHINLPSLDLQHFELSEGKGQEPTITEKLRLNVRSCATKTGTRLFVKPSLLSRPFDLPTVSERTSDFYLPFSEYNFTDLDTVSYQVPVVYKLETTLPSVQINSIFGSYESRTSFENNRLVCSRKVIMKGGRYDSKDFQAWVDFLKKIRKADRAQVVFVQNKP